MSNDNESHYIKRIYKYAMIFTLLSTPVALSYSIIEFNNLASPQTSEGMEAFAISALSIFAFMLVIRGFLSIHVTFEESVHKLNTFTILFVGTLAFVPILFLLAFQITLLLGVSTHLSLMMLGFSCIILIFNCIIATVLFSYALAKVSIDRSKNDEYGQYESDTNILFVITQYFIGQLLAICSLILISAGFFIIEQHHHRALWLFTFGGGLLIFTLLVPLAMNVFSKSKEIYFVVFSCPHNFISKKIVEPSLNYISKHRNTDPPKLTPVSIKWHGGFLLAVVILDAIFSALVTADVGHFKDGFSAFGGMAWFQTFIILAAILISLATLQLQNSHRFKEVALSQWEDSKLPIKVNIPAGILYVLTGCLAIFGVLTTVESSRNWMLQGLEHKGFGSVNISQSDGIKMIITAAVFGICIFLFLRNYRYHKVYSSLLNNPKNNVESHDEDKNVESHDEDKKEEDEQELSSTSSSRSDPK